MFKRLSIKIKLLLALLVLPILGLSTYTYFAVQLIKEDKLAYVINQTNNSARTLSTSILQNIENNRIINEVYLNDIFNKKSSKKNKLNKNIVLLKVYKYSKKSKKYIDQKEFSLLSDNYRSDLKKKNLDGIFEDFLSTFEREGSYFSLFKMLSDLQINLFITYDEKQKMVIFSGTVAETLYNQLEKETISSKYIKINDEIVYWGEKTSPEISDIFEKNKNIIFAKSSEQNDNVYSLGPSIGNSLIRVLTVIDKEYIYSPIYQLTEKTITFFLLLLGISFSISLVISDRLSKKLIALTDSVKKISSGNYDINLEVTSQDEVGELTESFNTMARTVRDLLKKLKKHNEELEITVAERTRDLRETLVLKDAMLNSLGQGFFIFKEDGAVDDIFTKATFEMFQNVKPNNKIWNILDLPEQETESFKKVVQHTFMQTLNFEDTVELAPKEMTNTKEKCLSLQYYPLTVEQKLEGIILVATDKTEEVQAINSWETERQETKKLSLAIKAQSMFYEFTKEFQVLHKDILEKVQYLNSENIKIILNYLHTMKGLSYQFFFKSVGEEIHQLENFIANNDFSTNESIQSITRSLLNIIKLYDQEFDLVSKHLNIKDSIEFNVPRNINSKILDDFFEKVKGTRFEGIYFNDIYSIAIEELLSPYCDLTQELAGRLHKEVLPINISGKEIRIHPTIYSSFFLSLNHIFRNILIHGIEDPYTREENGKNREGRITILVEDSLDSIQLTIQDDGKGIDIDKIKQKLEDFNHPILKENIDNNELIQIIFEPSFSTSDNINEDSGRGVGLSAVKEEIQKLRGQIKVISEAGNGTSFIISIPKFQN